MEKLVNNYPQFQPFFPSHLFNLTQALARLSLREGFG